MSWNLFAPDKLTDPTTVLGGLCLAAVMAIAAIVTSKILTLIMTKSRWVMGHLQRKVDETAVRYIIRVKTLGVFIGSGLIYASLVPSLQGLMQAMVASAGITAIVAGFAARSTLANLISGLSLAIYRPFRIGDTVSLDDEYGTVEDITLRHTIVRTWQCKRLILPNEKIDNMSIINYSIIDPVMLCTVELGVSYDTDIELARRLILEETSECPQRLENAEQPWVRVISNGDFSIGLRLYVWVPDMNAEWQARFWLLEHIKKRFDKEGVEIPFPYRTVVYKKDLEAQKI